MIDDAIYIFEEKVQRLEASRLRAFMRKGWKWGYNFVEDSPSETSIMPEIDDLEAYVLNLRFFIQDNEKSSIRNIANLYKNKCASPELRANFEHIRKFLNFSLEQKLWFKYNTHSLTYRELMEGIIYGKMAHTNHKNHSTVISLTKTGFGNTLAIASFLKCIDIVHQCLIEIRNINRVAFAPSI